MKIMIAFPPLPSEKGFAKLTSDGSFEWSGKPSYPYPLICASAATLLEKSGYQVTWADGIAQELSISQFIQLYKKEKPDLVAIEARTPIIQRYWKAINILKSVAPKTIFVLMGPHVTALPYESFNRCLVDYVLTGGDYDLLLLNLIRHLDAGEKLSGGIWFRQGPKVDGTGKFNLKSNLNLLPPIDRRLTKWMLYTDSNRKLKLSTNIMVARGCFVSNCYICPLSKSYPIARLRNVKNVLDEIGILIKDYKTKAIINDGLLPEGKWLKDFCKGLIRRKYNNKIKIFCQMRTHKLDTGQYRLMKKAGFVSILYQLESSSQRTLDIVSKATKLNNVIEAIKSINNAGLSFSLRTFIGYPWETSEEAKATARFAESLLDNNLAERIQIQRVTPYPGTQLFSYCNRDNLVKTKNWSDYDMTKTIVILPIPEEEIKNLLKSDQKTQDSEHLFSKNLRLIKNFIKKI